MKGALNGRGCWKGPGAIEVLLSFLLSTGGLRGGRTKFSAPRESILCRCGGGGTDVTKFTCGQVYRVNSNQQSGQQVNAIWARKESARFHKHTETTLFVVASLLMQRVSSNKDMCTGSLSYLNFFLDSMFYYLKRIT
jgi:hypothetical protein